MSKPSLATLMTIVHRNGTKARVLYVHVHALCSGERLVDLQIVKHMKSGGGQPIATDETSTWHEGGKFEV